MLSQPYMLLVDARRRLAILLALPACFAGCAAQTEEGDVGDDTVGTTSEELTTACGLGRSQILASVTGGRHTAIARGFGWYDDRVPYSQSRYHDGYRTDCSGFVSMAWQLHTSYTTADFIDGAGENAVLSSYTSLQPGDALVRRSGSSGHVVLFLGWSDKAKNAACVLEEESTALDMQFHARTTSSLHASGYHPIRADKFH